MHDDDYVLRLSEPERELLDGLVALGVGVAKNLKEGNNLLLSSPAFRETLSIIDTDEGDNLFKKLTKMRLSISKHTELGIMKEDGSLDLEAVKKRLEELGQDGELPRLIAEKIERLRAERKRELGMDDVGPI